MSIKATGSNYFKIDNCPINLCRISRRNKITHEHDLTEVEHYHDFVELIFIIQGKGIQVVEEHEYQVAAGDVFVLQGNQKHYFKDASQVEIVNVMVDDFRNPEIIPNIVRQLEGYKALFILEPNYRTRHHFKNKLRLNREELTSIELTLNAMFHEQNDQNVGFEIVLANRLQELIVILSRHYTSIGATEARSLVRLGKVLEYFENNPDEKIYIEDMASLANMSKRNFQRIFKRALGLSPVNYLTQIRLQKARKLLRETELQIIDISALTGFTDSNYFIKCFKQSFGTTPYKFRMQFKDHKKIDKKQKLDVIQNL